jgi:acetate kinase
MVPVHGENSPVIRAEICAGFEFLGISLDPGRNSTSAPVITRDRSRTPVRVLGTDEESIIARDTARVPKLKV